MEDIIDAQWEQGERHIPSVEYDEEKDGDGSSIEEAEEELEIILNQFKNKGKRREDDSHYTFTLHIRYAPAKKWLYLSIIHVKIQYIPIRGN